MSAGVARAASVRFALQSTALEDAVVVRQASIARAAIRRRRADREAAVCDIARPASSKRRRIRDADAELSGRADIALAGTLISGYAAVRCAAGGRLRRHAARRRRRRDSATVVTGPLPAVGWPARAATTLAAARAAIARRTTPATCVTAARAAAPCRRAGIVRAQTPLLTRACDQEDASDRDDRHLRNGPASINALHAAP